MGTLDASSGSSVERKIKIIDLTGFTPAQIETAFNNDYGKKGWRIVQVVQLGNKDYLIAEKEV